MTGRFQQALDGWLSQRCGGGLRRGRSQQYYLPLPSAEVLGMWNSLTGPALEAAVTSAYRPELA